MSMRPLINIAQECLQRLTGSIQEGEVSIQNILDQCYAILGTQLPNRNTSHPILEELRSLATLMNVPFQDNISDMEGACMVVPSPYPPSPSAVNTPLKSRRQVLIICPKCGKECTSGAAHASHMRTHERETDIEFESKIQDLGRTPLEIVKHVLLSSIVEPVVRKLERQQRISKLKGEDGRKSNHKGGVKHRKTYTLEYKAKCIREYELAVESKTSSPQINVAKQEQIDISMLGRWIANKDKIIESISAQGNKKLLSKDKIEKKNLTRKKRKRKSSVDLNQSNGQVPQVMAGNLTTLQLQQHLQHQQLQEQIHHHQVQHHMQPQGHPGMQGQVMHPYMQGQAMHPVMQSQMHMQGQAMQPPNQMHPQDMHTMDGHNQGGHQMPLHMMRWPDMHV